MPLLENADENRVSICFRKINKKKTSFDWGRITSGSNSSEKYRFLKILKTNKKTKFIFFREKIEYFSPKSVNV